MDLNLNNLESAIERDIAILTRFPEPRPSADCVDRLARAVLSESVDVRLRRGRFRRFLSAGPFLATAAILLLAIGVAWEAPQRVGTASSPEIAEFHAAGGDPVESLDDWVDAIDQSNQSITMLVDTGRMPDEFPVDVETDLNDFFEGLDRTLELGA